MKRGVDNSSFGARGAFPDGFRGAAVFDHDTGKVAHWSSGFWEVMGVGVSSYDQGLPEALHERIEVMARSGPPVATSEVGRGLRVERIGLSEGYSLLLLSEETQSSEGLTTRLYNWHRECVTGIVGMIADDIQGTASSLLYNATYLATRAGTTEVKEARDDLLQTSRAATTLMGRLSDLVKLRESAREIISVGEILEGARSLANRRAGAFEVELTLRVETSRLVSTNAILAQQALSEILLNASQSQGVTQIEISSELLAIQGVPLVRIRVDDDGAGVEEGLVERIFEPLFSTSVERPGLGLTVARESARALGGELTLDRRKGPTSFALLLTGVPKHDQKDM